MAFQSDAWAYSLHNNFQYCVEAYYITYWRHLILNLYWEHETRILEMIEALRVLQGCVWSLKLQSPVTGSQPSRSWRKAT